MKIKIVSMKRAVAVSIVLLIGSLASLPAADVKENWEKQCLKCHGPDGKGDTKLGKKSEVKDLTDAKVQEKFSDQELFKAIKEGVKEGEKIKMKPAEKLTEEEIKTLVTYVRSLKK
ncbi:MAG: cytochrome c [Verrucomicrobia bacterium]|nr:cytochrome c [Verrucomicrobiota bacterium]